MQVLQLIYELLMVNLFARMELSSRRVCYVMEEMIVKITQMKPVKCVFIPCIYFMHKKINLQLNICISFSCSRNKFRCHYGGCIDKKHRCDNTGHCNDKSDEKYCHYTTNCRFAYLIITEQLLITSFIMSCLLSPQYFDFTRFHINNYTVITRY